MAEVHRNKIRKVLKEATSISLALDEAKYRKIVRYRCDVPSAQSCGRANLGRNVGASGFSHSGVLGILDCSKKHASDFEDDHAVTAMKQLDSFLTQFCTPLGPSGRRRGMPQPLACDHELKEHIAKTVTCISADGAAKERRALFLAARELFRNLLIVIRDPAHAIRIAIKSLHCDEVFGKVWQELFNGRHALVPDLMNSEKWRNLFVAIQEDAIQAVAVPGQSPADALKAVVRNLGFAKQRFDSTADPVAKIALMLLPVATLLAHVASDQRHERAQRDRALALLSILDTKFCTAVDVSADWGVICKWLLRLFDVASHDIAKSRSQVDCMIETLDAVFVQGRVFTHLLEAPRPAALRRPDFAAEEPLPRVHESVSDDTGAEVGFITAKVTRNLRRQYVFFCRG